MKTTIAILLLCFSTSAWGADVEIAQSKDWRADKLEAHKVSELAACVAKTAIKGKDLSLEVYAEANADGGFVQPMVQIVGTDLPPALGVMLKMSPGGRELPLSISLKETKMIKKEVLEEGSTVPVLKDVERQVFVAKFQDKERLIKLIRAKSKIKATFFAESGEVAQESFSLRGSSKTVKKMMSTCL